MSGSDVGRPSDFVSFPDRQESAHVKELTFSCLLRRINTTWSKDSRKRSYRAEWFCSPSVKESVVRRNNKFVVSHFAELKASRTKLVTHIISREAHEAISQESFCGPVAGDFKKQKGTWEKTRERLVSNESYVKMRFLTWDSKGILSHSHPRNATV